MAWTTPPTFSSLATLGASQLTILGNNEIFLLNGELLGKLQRDAAANSNSNTYVDVDAVNLILTVTVTSGRVFIDVSMYLSASNVASNYGAVTVIMDSTTYPDNQNATYGMAAVLINSTSYVSFRAVFSGVSAGSHTFKLQWKSGIATGVVSNGGGTLPSSNINMTATEY